MSRNQYGPTEESLGIAVAICQMLPTEEGKDIVNRWLAERDSRVARETLTRLVEDAKEKGFRQLHLMSINVYRDQKYPEGETP